VHIHVISLLIGIVLNDNGEKNVFKMLGLKIIIIIIIIIIFMKKTNV